MLSMRQTDKMLRTINGFTSVAGSNENFQIIIQTKSLALSIPTADNEIIYSVQYKDSIKESHNVFYFLSIINLSPKAISYT